MKKQLLAAAIVVGLGSATSTVSGEVQYAPNAEVGYKIVKKLNGSAGAQAVGQAVGAALGSLVGSVFGPFGTVVGSGLGAY